MIDIEVSQLNRYTSAAEIGKWLEENMPNPPLPDPQRWNLGYSQDGRVGIQFANDADAMLFALRWS